jgi:hypothetical protein
VIACHSAIAPPPVLFEKAPGPPSFPFPPMKSEGAERREASPYLRPRFAKHGARLAIDAPASRRSTGGSRHRSAERWLSHGPRFLGSEPRGPCPVQRAPRSAVLVPHERGPEAARERGYEPRPQAPHLAPICRTSPEDALDEQGIVTIFLIDEIVKR